MTCQGQKFFCETPVRQAVVSDQTGLFPGSPKGVGIALKLPNHFISFPGLSQQPPAWKGYTPAAAALCYLSVVVPGSCLTRPG